MTIRDDQRKSKYMFSQSHTKTFDLEDRCLNFAIATKSLIKALPKSLTNNEYSRQLARSSASIGANYIEANEMLSKKDFILRAKIAKKEARETRYWLKLVDINKEQTLAQEHLVKESTELMHILGSIIERMK